MAQGDLTPQAIHRLQRYSNTAWNEHRDFSYGMCQDLPSYASPEASVYDSVDWLFDTPGKIRKRGGWTTPCSADGTLTATQIGRALNPRLSTKGTIYLNDSRPTGGSQLIYSLNTSTGAKTSIVSIIPTPDSARMGRAIEHLGACVMPVARNDNSTPGQPFVSQIMCFQGASAAVNVNLAHPASTVITAALSKITVGGGDTTGTMAIGQWFHASDGTNAYLGKVESVLDSTHFTVYPTPAISFTPSSARFSTALDLLGDDGLSNSKMNGAYYAASFQNRLILANTIAIDSGDNSSSQPVRVVYSILPDETPSDAPANTQSLWSFTLSGFEDDNFFDVAASSPISSLAPMGEGQLMIFSQFESFRLTGQLETQTATSSGVSVDVRKISSTIGCLADKSVQSTPRGIVFAAMDGVYAYDGSQFHPLMNQRVANIWRSYINNSAAIPVGAALVLGNHYVVHLATSTGAFIDTLIVNLDTLAWGRLSNTPISGAVADPADPSITWAANLPSGAYTAGVTSRPLIRLDSMFVPTSANRTDGNTTAVAPVLKTKSYPEGDPNTRKRFRRVQVEYDMRGGSPTLAVASDTKLKAADASYTTLVTAAGSSSVGTTSAAAEVVFDSLSKLTKGVAIEHQFTQTGGSDTTEILGIKHGFQQLREGRSV